MEIVTSRLRLRRFRRADLETFVAYRRDPEVARFQSWGASYTLAQAESFLADQETVEPGQVGTWLQLAIEEQATGALCGDCGVHLITEQPRTAELGVSLGSPYQGRGIASEALTAVLDWLFGELDLHRAFAQVDDRNNRMQRLLERLGFRQEAPLHRRGLVQGGVDDTARVRAPPEGVDRRSRAACNPGGDLRTMLRAPRPS